MTNLISYGNVTAGMADENTFTGTTPTYSIYYYDETAGDTPGAGCLDSASNDPLFVSTTDFHLKSNSPCRNGGILAAGNPYSSVVYDLDGRQITESDGTERYQDESPIGCYLYWASEVTIHVDLNATGGAAGSSRADAYVAIQTGVNDAAGGDTVLVWPGTYTGAGNVNIDPGAAPNGKHLSMKILHGTKKERRRMLHLVQ